MGVLSGQVGTINLAASHVIMLTANCARGRERGNGIEIAAPTGTIQCKAEGITITMIGVEGGWRQQQLFLIFFHSFKCRT